MTLAELCKYGQEHLAGEQGHGKLLSAATYKQLHAPRLNNYACGWVVPDENPWVDEPIIWHNGSNKMWYAFLVLLPQRNAVLAVTSNDGDIQAAQQAATEILKRVFDAEGK